MASAAVPATSQRHEAFSAPPPHRRRPAAAGPCRRASAARPERLQLDRLHRSRRPAALRAGKRRPRALRRVRQLGNAGRQALRRALGLRHHRPVQRAHLRAAGPRRRAAAARPRPHPELAQPRPGADGAGGGARRSGQPLRGRLSLGHGWRGLPAGPRAGAGARRGDGRARFGAPAGERGALGALRPGGDGQRDRRAALRAALARPRSQQRRRRRLARGGGGAAGDPSAPARHPRLRRPGGHARHRRDLRRAHLQRRRHPGGDPGARSRPRRRSRLCRAARRRAPLVRHAGNSRRRAQPRSGARLHRLPAAPRRDGRDQRQGPLPQRRAGVAAVDGPGGAGRSRHLSGSRYAGERLPAEHAAAGRGARPLPRLVALQGGTPTRRAGRRRRRCCASRAWRSASARWRRSPV